ncbi:MAG: hypothetical protein JWR61_5879 [Ferruginibacter sp.]|nr:hypothetical protein [Ferruginibacter sp.]
MADNIGITPGSGAVAAADDIGGGVLVQRVKPTWGVDGTATDVTSTTPFPVREPVKGSALGKGGGTSSATAQTLITTNASRTCVEVGNGSASGVWLAFGATATAGTGTYLPSKATGYWYTTAAVSYIMEASGTAGPVGYTEW